jgi:hypothetical protein
LRTTLVALACLTLTGCATVAEVELTEDSCRQSFQDALSSILVEQHETPGVAAELADRTREILERAQLGPRPFVVSSSSGADYEFFVQKKSSGCLLRLYGRQKGFTSYTNDLTYIATRPLPGCACKE